MISRMTFRTLLALFSLIFFIPAAHAAEAAQQIGTVIELEGTATRTASALIKPLNINDAIYLNDSIRTFAGAKILILLIDDTEITLGDNSTLVLDRYIFDPDNATPPHATFNILQGSFLLVSGLVSKVAAPDMKINTSYGTIGLRGTTVWGGVLDNEYGVLVQEGEVEVTNQGGTTIIPRGQGSFMRDAREKPRPPKAWAQAKTDRAVKTILLERREMVKLKLEQAKAENIDRRTKRPAIIEKRIELREELPEKIEQLKKRPARGKESRETKYLQPVD